MKIERMNKGSWGKVRAFFDIRTEEGLVVKGFKIMEGINGLFVSMPSQKGKNQQGEDEWFDTVWVEKDLRDQLNQMALNEYGSLSVTSYSSIMCGLILPVTISLVPDRQESIYYIIWMVFFDQTGFVE